MKENQSLALDQDLQTALRQLQLLLHDDDDNASQGLAQ